MEEMKDSIPVGSSQLQGGNKNKKIILMVVGLAALIGAIVATIVVVDQQKNEAKATEQGT